MSLKNEKMVKIKESVKTLFENKHHYDAVNKFALESYNKRFKDLKKDNGTYHRYECFEIISDNTIRVIYKYGTIQYDFDYTSFFDVEL